MNEKVVNDVYSVYKVLLGSLKITRRTINKDLNYLHQGIDFYENTKDSKINQVNDAITELNDLMVLSLFAAFERELRISIRNIIQTNTIRTNPTVEELCILTIESIERWTVLEMLDALKTVVDSSTRGKIKQVYEYRNWVAHGKNSNNLPAIQTTPQDVFRVLKNFIKQASVAI